MRRKIFTFSMVFFLILSSLIVIDITIDLVTTARGVVIYVGGGGSENHSTIQEGIDAADDGDVVFVYNGTYFEHVIVNKSISLIGEDRSKTYIDGNWNGDVVKIVVDSVNISGFNIRRSGANWNDSGIELDNVQNCRISNNIITFNDNYGIFLNSSKRNQIIDNIASVSNYYAITLVDSSSNNIKNNTVAGNYYGIYLDYSNRNNITNNSVLSADAYGIYLFYSDENNISANIVDLNHLKGINLRYSNYNNISSNLVTNSVWGISLSSSQGNNITVNNASYNDEGIYISGSYKNNVINNIAKFNERSGIYLKGCTMENYLEDNNVSHNGNGIKIEDSSDDTIIDNFIMNNRYGIYIFDSICLRIYFNTMINDGIVLIGDSIEYWNTHEIEISNTINSKPVYYWRNKTQGSVPLGAGQVILANCTNINVKDQVITHVAVGIGFGFSSKNNITSNNVSENGWCGIFLWESNENIVNENIAFNNSNGFEIWYSNGNNFFDNNVSSNTNGIYIIYSNGNIIINNSAYQNDDGLYFHTSNENTISRNNASLNNETGILLFQCQWNNITNNFVSENNLSGIFIYYSEKNNAIDNSIFSNTLGFWFYRAKYNNISHNMIISNTDHGLYVQYSSNNLFFFNNIIGNSVQAYDDKHDNYWDSGYPLGGNYWSDYSGNDNFKGPDQDQLGSDGIGDTNYTIDSDSIDNYPLMEPYSYKSLENYTILKQGWNLISIPLIQQNQNLQKVLEMIDGYYDSVQWYNPLDQGEQWKHYKVGKPYGNDLFKLNETMGFWIHITNPGDTIFLYNGTQPTQNQTISLSKGWNLVGYPSQTSYNRTEGLNKLKFGKDVDAIWSNNASSQNWNDMGESDYFIIGKGYYI
ncbi:MAG: right-handed parallel beta-helix repeat-containing protein, partial [Thermoplasmata archaeon]